MNTLGKCVFLDKDGTLIHDVPYNVDIGKIRCYDDIYGPLQRLSAAGYQLIIVSNQAGLAKRYFTEAELHPAFEHLITVLGNEGIAISGYYYCPHAAPDAPEKAACLCRKPQPGLLLQAAEDHHIDLSRSWMIGDILADTGAGRAAGCRTILLDRSGHERTLPAYLDPALRPDYLVDDFRSVDTIIQNTKLHDYECTYRQHYSAV